MNMHLTISTDPSPTQARLHAAYLARRAKEAAAARKVASANQNAPAVKREPVKLGLGRPHDAHMKAWEDWKRDMGSPVKAHIRRRCAELGVTYEELTSPARHKEIVGIRDLLAYEIKFTVKPQISWPELGRILNREHSAVFYAVMKMRAASGDQVAIDRLEKRKARMKRARDRYESKEQGA